MNAETLPEATPIEDIEAYMELEYRLEEALADNRQYLIDVALGPANAAAHMSLALTYYLERKPTRFPVDISQHAVLDSTNTPTLRGDGESVVAWSTMLEYPDGLEREIVALTDGATPIHSIHELAHLIDLEAGHTYPWRVHFAALIEERYGHRYTL
jgi:hypothetical protein